MGTEKGWTQSPPVLAPKIMSLRCPFQKWTCLGWNLQSLPRYWRQLKAYLIPSLHMRIKWMAWQACKRDEDLAAPHRWEETPLLSSHSHLLLQAAKGQTWESTLSIMVCLIRPLKGSQQKWFAPLGKRNTKENMSLLTAELVWKTLIDFNFSRKWPSITVKLMDFNEWHFACHNAKQEVKSSCFLL